MDWQVFLFSTSGRITRAQFWLAVLIYVLVAMAASTAALIILTEPPSDLGALAVLPGLLFSAGNGLVSAQTQNTVWFIAGALGLWGVVELGCLRGTEGANRFGDDPLAANVPAASSAARP